MRFSITVSTLLIGVVAAVPLSKRTVNFSWGSENVRGVNLGGWLVLEPWITPSIFQQFPGHETVDEWTLCQNHPDTAHGILKQHWDNWVSLSDFQTIANAGFNTVRIPVGYWAFQKFNDPYIQGAAPYLDEAISWARQTGLKVWIDLHGAPGSQNGFDNSGHNGTVGWGTGSTVADTLSVIQQIANKYAQDQYQDVVVAIEVLNEPLATSIAGGLDTVLGYYDNAYGDIRSISDTEVMVHDAFQTGTTFNDVLTSSGGNVVIDHHEYQVFTEELINLSPDEHVQYVCSNANTYASNVDHWVVVGEWSAAMTDCAPALNGYGLGSRWEGSYPLTGAVPSTRSCGDINFIDTWNQTTKDNTQRFIEAQLDVYETQTQGFVFWNFKTEASAEWDLERLLNAGVFPSLVNRQPTGSLCST
ncbi:hypothetical protein JMJ35_008592 [Cladonia borealis]|uniref:glucan 1,3-beta-glucosidase n=1 Tax=Cladonia borealis TaxID=184061 RepID=A0AA39QVJ1_9LECA|nr:hypothetical protein JMJ35_008592 [Cladonia borealis]